MSSISPQPGEPDADDAFAELIARVRRGDEQAAAELVHRYEGIIRRRARRLLGPALRVHLDSVDIAQSVNRTLLIGLRRASFAVSTPEELTRLAPHAGAPQGGPALAQTSPRNRAAQHGRRPSVAPNCPSCRPSSSYHHPTPWNSKRWQARCSTSSMASIAS